MFLVTLGAALAALAPGPYWLDSSEFAAAAFELGVAHPPGHPLALLVGKAAALVPIGSVAMRVGFASALLAALAAAFTSLLASGLARRVLGGSAGGGDGLVEALLGATAGLGFGLGHAAMLQAVRPEVYALNAALLVIAAQQLARLDEDGDARHAATAALCVGLALANHHLLAGLFALAAAPWLVTRARRLDAGPARALGMTAAAGLLGLAAYAYLPLRALRHPEVDWGAPSTAARFLWTVSAQAFQKSLGHAALGGGPEVGWALALELGVLAPLVLVGMWVVLSRPALRGLGLLLLGAVLLDAAAPALVGFDADNPDAYGYLEPAVALGAVIAVGGAAALFGRLGARPSPRALALGLALVTTLLAARSLPSRSLARFDATGRLAATMLAEAPPRAALFSSYFQSVFALWYLRGVEGQRPDVAHLHRHFLAYPGYRDEALARLPELAPLVGEKDLAPTAALLAAARTRPILVEYDLDLDPELVAHLAPGVAIDSLSPAPPGDAARTAAEEHARAGREALERAVGVSEPQTRRALLWLEYLAAQRDCSLGRTTAGRAAIARARALLGATPDADLEELANRCGGPSKSTD